MHCLQGCDYALLWPWDAGAVKAQVGLYAMGGPLCSCPRCYQSRVLSLLGPLSPLPNPLRPCCFPAVALQSVPVVVEGPHLLYTLNRYLTHSALLVQPLTGELGGPAPGSGSASHPALSDTPALATLDIPLPLPQPGGEVRAGG